MPFDLAVFAAKLAFGTLAFLLIGWIGSSDDRRVAGAMLTFPVLNGIGLVTSPDKNPVALTAAMMPIIVLNGCLCFAFVVAFRWARSARGEDRTASYATGIAAALAWGVLAIWLAPQIDPQLPPPAVITAFYVVTASVGSVALWSRVGRRSAARTAAATVTFGAFWWQRRWRVVLFGISLFALLVAAQIWDAAWVGRLSALPIVPLFVLAGLAIDDADSLPAIRDTILLGPGLAMIFVLALTAFLASLDHAGGTTYWAPAIIALAIGWTACFLAIRYAVPPLAAALDRPRP